jgi:chromosome segregation ATPase
MNIYSKEATDSLDKKTQLYQQKRYATPQNPASFLGSKVSSNSSQKRFTFENHTKPMEPVRSTEAKDQMSNTQPINSVGFYNNSRSIYDRHQYDGNSFKNTINPNTMKESLQSQQMDQNMIQQFQDLQRLLMNNPNILQHTENLISISKSPSQNFNIHGSNVKSTSNYINQIGELEKALGEQRIENEKLKTTLKSYQFDLESYEKQLEVEKEKAASAMEELDSCQELRNRLDESVFEIQKLESERDFHHKNHMDLRKERYNRSNGEFQVVNLKRELSFKSEEVEALKNRCQELQQNVEELMIFAEKPLNEKESSTETFYAKKIVELESIIKRLRDEHSDVETIGARRSRRLSPRSASYKDLAFHNGGSNSDEKLVTLKIENDALKQKIETNRKENNMLRSDLERLKLKEENSNREPNPVPQAQKLLKEYQDQISSLQQENQKLRQSLNSKISTGKHDNEEIVSDLQKMVSALETEKGQLLQKIDSLQTEIAYKNRELVRLHELGGEDTNQETIQNLINANKRMTVEINRLQEQIRKMESFSRDSMLDSYQ